MKKLVLIFLTVLLFSSANLPYVLADTSSLTHEQMVENYGQGYADTYFKTFLEGNAKMAINEAENREALDGWIDGSKEYLSKRYQAYANLSAENGYTPLDFFKEVAIDGITLTETGFDFLKSIFSSDDDLLPVPPAQVGCLKDVGSVSSPNFRIEVYSCGLYVRIPTFGNNYYGVYFYNGEFKAETLSQGTGAFIKDRKFSFQKPTTLRGLDNIIKSAYGPNSGIIDKNGNFIFGVPATDFVSNISTINNFIRDYTPRPLRIPILEPNAVCKDGQRVIFPDGSGGYLDGNGKPVSVSDCTITWKEPVIERAPDGQLMIDDKVLEGEEQVPPKEDNGEGCDGVLCFLGGIAKAIGGLVSSLLEGLVAVFIPSDTSFIDKSFEKIQTTFTQKFAVIDSLKSVFTESFKETDTNALKDYSISIPFLGDKPIKIINFDYVDPYIGLFKNGLSAIMVIYTAWYCYRKVTGGGGVMEK